jgi:hypothetical protein
MSRATVLVKVSAERIKKHSGDLDAALTEMMAPYDENTEDRRFLEFEDEEDEERKKYETESAEKVRTPDGELLWPWDERFRVPGALGTGSSTHKIPSDCQDVSVPFKELYPTFEAFAADYCGYKARDKDKGRFGYWRNPNKTWDWYQIGGRWTGHFPLKTTAPCQLGKRGVFGDAPESGHGDVVHVGDIDMDAVATKTREATREFFDKYIEILAGKDDGDFFGPRHTAMGIGLCRVERGPYTAKDNERVVPWLGKVKDDDDRKTWSDVWRVLDFDTFFAEYEAHFNPLGTYAALDDDGWHAPGAMGWWGMSSDNAEDRIAFDRAFVSKFIKTAQPDDLLVCVDYHI